MCKYIYVQLNCGTAVVAEQGGFLVSGQRAETSACRRGLGGVSGVVIVSNVACGMFQTCVWVLLINDISSARPVRATLARLRLTYLVVVLPLCCSAELIP